MTARADRDARRAQGLLLALVLVVSQASAWFHAIAIAHVACLEHGEAVHRATLPTDEGRAAESETAAGARADLAVVGGHDHCANAALLRWRDVALTAPAALAPLVPPARPMSLAAPSDGAPVAVVYRIAPKTSPPFALA